MGHDKWQLLDALSSAADLYDLSHRTLGVLRALLSFHPDRIISPGARDAIVFPANRTLSDRLHGMPESTLRRHLARLVELGIIHRHDSPNRKRFARRQNGSVGLAFGFDLSPLARHATQLFDAAKAAENARERLAILRADILHLRAQYLCLPNLDTSFLAEMNRLLRRKPDAEKLTALLQDLRAKLADDVSEKTPQMSANNIQNERHIQTEEKSITDSETPQTDIEIQNQKTKTPLTVSDIKHLCPTLDEMFPNQLFTWQDLQTCAHHLAPMLGIERPVWLEAVQNLGLYNAMIVLFCIHERFDEIQNPGAYIRHLSRNAGFGKFDISPMLQALSHRSDRRVVS
jgi:replication initiation protein RepC